MNPLALQWLIRVLGAAVVLAVLWLAVVTPRLQLRDERAAHADTKRSHAELLANIAARSENVARLAVAARDSYYTGKAEAKARHDEEVRNAFERGRSVASGIGAGRIVVHEVWRDRECPQAAAGEGTELTPGFALVPRGRADAIGRVLGLAGGFDAQYKQAIQRLILAQEQLDVCYEQTSGAAP